MWYLRSGAIDPSGIVALMIETPLTNDAIGRIEMEVFAPTIEHRVLSVVRSILEKTGGAGAGLDAALAATDAARSSPPNAVMSQSVSVRS
jgi:hypothetical protein